VLEAPLRLWPAVAGPVSSRVAAGLERPPVAWVRRAFARRHAVVALLLYVAGAVVMQRHSVEHLATQISGNVIGDPSCFMWSMWWWPHALLSGTNPFITHAIWVPDAYPLGSVTSTPLPSILFAPLNALIGWNQGPVVSYNLCMLLAPVLSAWFTYRLCLYLRATPAAAIAGGWLFGFCAYGLSQLQGHMNLVFTFLPVVLVLLSLQRLDDRITRRRYVTLSAVAVAAQIGISTEIVFTTTALLVVAALATLALAPGPVRRRTLRVLIPELALGYLLAGLVTSPALYYAVTGPKVSASANSAFKVADLLSYIIPTPIVRIGAFRFAALSSAFPAAGGYIETGTYLGLPLVIGAVAYWVANSGRWAVRVMLTVAAVAFVWSLGGQLSIAGIETISLPFKLLQDKPVFSELTPVRLGVYVELCAAIAFALWLSLPGRLGWLKWLLAVAAAAFLFANTDGSFSSGAKVFDQSVASPAFITDGAYRHYLHHGEAIMPIPFGPDGNSMIWQAQARGYFRLASGWFGYYPPGYATSRVMGELLSFAPYTDPFRLMRRFFAAHDVGAVVMLPAQAGPWPAVMTQLGLRRVSVGGVWLYNVPAALRAG
jgi:hypothetical protein